MLTFKAQAMDVATIDRLLQNLLYSLAGDLSHEPHHIQWQLVLPGMRLQTLSKSYLALVHVCRQAGRPKQQESLSQWHTRWYLIC